MIDKIKKQTFIRQLYLKMVYKATQHENYKIVDYFTKYTKFLNRRSLNKK